MPYTFYTLLTHERVSTHLAAAFSELLSAYAEKNRLSTVEIADLCYVSQPTVSRLLNGTFTGSLKTIEQICVCLGIGWDIRLISLAPAREGRLDEMDVPDNELVDPKRYHKVPNKQMIHSGEEPNQYDEFEEDEMLTLKELYALREKDEAYQRICRRNQEELRKRREQLPFNNRIRESRERITKRLEKE